ncbi:Dyp-type peroxidase family [Ceratobasidium sp. AG-Ba]|nr:Dyp-type peroxidase family [Ceratobasidium sp. AG-Ba]
MSHPAHLINSNSGAIRLENIQGDVLFGFSKDHEIFTLFTITNPDEFKKKLPSVKITTSQEVAALRKEIARVKVESPGQRLQTRLLNIGFSQQGLEALGIEGNLNDDGFKTGQYHDAYDLGDRPKDPDGPYEPDWKDAYTKRIDGILLGAGNNKKNAEAVVNDALKELQDSVQEIYRLEGKARLDNNRVSLCDALSSELQAQRELDNIPAFDIGLMEYPILLLEESWIPYLDKAKLIRVSVILVGLEGDYEPKTKNPKQRPIWAVEGSFMAFRELKQLVPEFNEFLRQNPYGGISIPRELGSKIQGARFFGRWKNGVPIELSPTFPDPKLVGDKRNNNFNYSQETGDEGQASCPYSAHIRKMRPRTDLPENRREATRIMRKGIPYGDEVKPEEARDNKTYYERGLAFVCYQSNLSDNGFRHIQKAWANDPNFLHEQKKMECGYDPIIGQTRGPDRRRTTMNEEDKSSISLLEDFVVAQGGEYFFTPSIRALYSVFCGKPYPGEPKSSYVP